MELEKNEYLQSKGLSQTYMYKMQPLDPAKGQVKLVDPNDKWVALYRGLTVVVIFSDACDAEWRHKSEIGTQLNQSKQEQDENYVRLSTRTGYIIPFPKQAYVTYDYISRENYIGKFLIFLEYSSLLFTHF